MWDSAVGNRNRIFTFKNLGTNSIKQISVLGEQQGRSRHLGRKVQNEFIDKVNTF